MTEFRKWINSHWKTLSLIMVVILALISVVYVYTKFGKSPSQSTPISTFSLYPVELKTELIKTEFAVREPVEIRLYLKNISNRTIVASFGSAKVFDFNVTDANGRPVYVLSQNILYTQAPISKLLHPSETLNRTFNWDQTYGSRAFKDKYRQTVPLGTYYVEGFTALSFVASYWDGETPVEPFMFYYGEPTGVEGELHIPKINIIIG